MLSTVVPGSPEPQPAGSVQHHDAGGRSTELSAHMMPAKRSLPSSGPRSCMAVERAFRSTSPVSQLTSRPFSGKCGFSLTLSGATGCLRLCPRHTWPPGPLPRSVPGFLASLLSWAPPGKRGPELLCCLCVNFLPPCLECGACGTASPRI